MTPTPPKGPTQEKKSESTTQSRDGFQQYEPIAKKVLTLTLSFRDQQKFKGEIASDRTNKQPAIIT